jgi:hypothetical protein
LPAQYLAVRDAAIHGLGIGTTRAMRSVITGVFVPSWLSRSYTLSEKVNSWRGKAFSARLLRDVEHWPTSPGGARSGDGDDRDRGAGDPRAVHLVADERVDPVEAIAAGVVRFIGRYVPGECAGTDDADQQSHPSQTGGAREGAGP